MDLFDLRLWSGFIRAFGKSSPEPMLVDQITIDSRRIASTHSLFIPLNGNSYNGHQFIPHAAKSGAKYALASHDWVPEECGNLIVLKVNDPLLAFQEIVATYRKQLPTKIIGITGSYGKTMVKDLLLEMLKSCKFVTGSPESFNSQIGVPLSLLNIKKEHEIAIIEAGISKKEEMKALTEMILPDCGILTHIGKKHLSSIGDIKTTSDEMSKLLHYPSKEGWVLIPDDPLVNLQLSSIKATPFFWNKLYPDLPFAKPLTTELSTKIPYTIHFPDGYHFTDHVTSGYYYFFDLLNISIKAAWLLGVPSQLIAETIRCYNLEPMRTEIWESPSKTVFINDTYCSDPQSVDKSLQFFIDKNNFYRKIFVFGGMKDKKQSLQSDYKRIGKAINKAKIDLLILYGHHEFLSLIDEIRNISPDLEILHYTLYQEAINFLKGLVKPSDIVLIKGDKKEPLETIIEAFNDSVCSNHCLVNLATIKSNIETMRKTIPHSTHIMVMVKALAYGTNDIQIAHFLSSCQISKLGVSYVDEGAALRREGIKQSIFVINAATYEATKIVKWDLEVGVSERSLIEAIALEAVRCDKKIKVHLHIDTGMSRFGCRTEEALELAFLIKNSPSLILEGIMTHFACADDPNEDLFTLSQSKCFDHVIESLKNNGITAPFIHAANSSGAIRFKFPQYNMIRIGLAIYGLFASEHTRKEIDLQLALCLISRIVGINICKEGESISYGRSYIVKEGQKKIAVLPIGYFDGIHRNYSGKGTVSIRGHQVPMIGNICMDFMMVDVTSIPHVSIGDPVLIFGEDEFKEYLSPEDLAAQGNSIVHELVTCLGPRIQRIFIYEENH